MAAFTFRAFFTFLFLVNACSAIIIYGDIEWHDVGSDVEPGSSASSTTSQHFHADSTMYRPIVVNEGIGSPVETTVQRLNHCTANANRHKENSTIGPTLVPIRTSASASLRNLSRIITHWNKPTQAITTTLSTQSSARSISGQPSITTFGATESSDVWFQTNFATAGHVKMTPSPSSSVQASQGAFTSAGTPLVAEWKAITCYLIGLASLHELFI
ncbi:uncharacterized protein BO97DRAFT_449859 [Aspergillus homomorphus CBS 101889]|uniref:Uncharacterized protein n=1 Tax=Aspergillus homomorphus (strain CBS 101889) TaxID=1450537 RepID=A0A395HG76_ASPHC|nr:hypothetical protein BO97DRAFT_449859 [Aspergillus homomorphus CBS 101889]RAL06509.1 hypothetical protein BO97DRAFT_449859 [Aspergillus homomorphus CBS 101889]